MTDGQATDQENLFRIEHETVFHYSQPVRDVGVEVRVRPADDAHQVCEWFELRVEPEVRVFNYRDFYGNTVYNFSIPERTDRVRILARARVRTHSPSASTPPPPLAPMDDYEMRLESEYVQVNDPGIQRLAADFTALQRQNPQAAVEAVMDYVQRAFSYVPGSTDVNTKVASVLENACGVCQDFAHVMIAVCRAVGIPSRYVSGYLYGGTGDTGGDVVGTGATHAWMEAYLTGQGWVGYDPTNNVRVGLRHIKVAVGRDYADVPPTRGVYKGKTEEKLEVNVSVRQEEERLKNKE